MEAFRAQPGFSTCYQTSDNYQWAMMMTERSFVTSAQQGIAIALLFAFIILIVATANILLAVLAILCVIEVVITSLAVMVM